MKCQTAYCKNQAAPNRKICYACKTRAHRKADMMRYSYDTLITNCIRRGKFFDLTYEQFQLFCYETKYFLGKGRTKVSFTIDCIIPDLYTLSNLRVVTKGENSRKGVKTLVYDWEHKDYAVYV